MINPGDGYRDLERFSNNSRYLKYYLENIITVSILKSPEININFDASVLIALMSSLSQEKKNPCFLIETLEKILLFSDTMVIFFV